MKTTIKTVLSLTLVTLCGCAGPSWDRTPLSHEKRDYIAARSKQADELKIDVHLDSNGKATLRQVRTFPLGLSGYATLRAPGDNAAERVCTTITLNGLEATALLNTATPATLIDFDNARQFSLTPIAATHTDDEGGETAQLLQRIFPSPGGALYQFTGMAHTLTFGNVKVYNVPLGILDDERGMHALWWLLEGVPVDVVMGYDVLGSFDYLTVNFRDRALRVASGRYRPQPDRLVAAIALHVGHGVPLVEAFIDGRGPFPTALATGGSFGLWLPRNMAEALELPGMAFEEPQTGRDRGAAPRTTALSADREVDLGGFQLQRVPTTVGLLDVGDDDIPYALLGNRALGDYAVTIDRKAGKVYFETP